MVLETFVGSGIAGGHANVDVLQSGRRRECTTLIVLSSGSLRYHSKAPSSLARVQTSFAQSSLPALAPNRTEWKANLHVVDAAGVYAYIGSSLCRPTLTRVRSRLDLDTVDECDDGWVPANQVHRSRVPRIICCPRRYRLLKAMSHRRCGRIVNRTISHKNAGGSCDGGCLDCCIRSLEMVASCSRLRIGKSC